MKTNFKNVNKAAIICIIVAFILSFSTIFLITIIFSKQLNMAKIALESFHNSSSVSNNDIVVEDIDGQKLITQYPFYGQLYGNITIDSVGVDLPIYFGDSNEILSNGVGHSTGSYFPGEGGSIIYGAHHSSDKFGKLEYISVGDIVTVTTDYGIFNYIVTEMKVINETDVDLLPIQREEEKLMLYTCYPFGYLGYATQRYAVYCDFVNYEDIEED